MQKQIIHRSFFLIKKGIFLSLILAAKSPRIQQSNKISFVYAALKNHHQNDKKTSSFARFVAGSHSKWLNHAVCGCNKI